MRRMLDETRNAGVVWHISLAKPYAMKGAIHIGTSGWSYKHWRDIFYPPALKTAEWLRFYSRQFSIAEINTSFYRIPKQQSVLEWMEKVPPDFRFCAKMSRYLTHMKKLLDPEEPLERFFGVFEPMQPRMGPVLLQLPVQVKFHYDRTEHLFILLKKKYGNYDFVIEIRHGSWLEVDSLSLMTKYDIGFVISQSGGFFPFAEIVTGTHIYIRFHGPAALYASAYSDEELEQWAAKMLQWSNEGHEVWAFFNNDIHGHAFRDAARLLQLTGAK